MKSFSIKYEYNKPIEISVDDGDFIPFNDCISSLFSKYLETFSAISTYEKILENRKDEQLRLLEQIGAEVKINLDK